VISVLEKLKVEADHIQTKLREVGLIKGHAQNLQKLQHDIEVKISQVQATSHSAPLAKAVHPIFKKNESMPALEAHYRNDWIDRVSFEVCDAAKRIERYRDSRGDCCSHIYSYNKVMSVEDRKGISKILNRTNFKIMAWYFGPRESAQSGLKRVKLAFKMPMQSTGKEKFTVYVYYKTAKYDPACPWSDSESDAESDNECTANTSNNISGQKKPEVAVRQTSENKNLKIEIKKKDVRWRSNRQ